MTINIRERGIVEGDLKTTFFSISLLSHDSWHWRTMPKIAVRSAEENQESVLLKRFKDEIPNNVGSCTDFCEHCGAAHWLREKIPSRGIAHPAHYSMCCRGGKVELPRHYFTFPPIPRFMYDLLTSDSNGLCLTSFYCIWILINMI
jgi:hypothetical protein